MPAIDRPRWGGLCIGTHMVGALRALPPAIRNRSINRRHVYTNQTGLSITGMSILYRNGSDLPDWLWRRVNELLRRIQALHLQGLGVRGEGRVGLVEIRVPLRSSQRL